MVGVRETTEDASVDDGGDEEPLRFLNIFPLAFPPSGCVVGPTPINLESTFWSERATLRDFPVSGYTPAAPHHRSS